MVNIHIFYGGRGSGKTRAGKTRFRKNAMQLAKELCATHGHYPDVKSVTIIDWEQDKQIDQSVFRLLASGTPLRRRSLYGQATEVDVQALIICMHVQAPSPIAGMPVSLVAKGHVLQKLLLVPSLGISDAASILKPFALRMSDLLCEQQLPYKLWLATQLPLPSEICVKCYEISLKEQLVAYLTNSIGEWLGLGEVIMRAHITAL